MPTNSPLICQKERSRKNNNINPWQMNMNAKLYYTGFYSIHATHLAPLYKSLPDGSFYFRWLSCQ